MFLNVVESLNSLVPSDLMITIVVLIVGIFSITSNAIGIDNYRKSGQGHNSSYVFLWIMLVPSVLVTLMGLYGLYHNMTH